MRKKHIFLFVLLTLAVFLTACGKKVKSESEIQEDVLSRASFIEDYQLANTQFAISNRETSKTTDTVWTSVDANSELMQCHADCILVYTLYNNGWELDSVTWNNQTFIGNSDAVTQDNADDALYDLYGGELGWFEFLGKESSTNKVCFQYNAGSEEYYLDREYSINVEFTFNPEDHWVISSATKTLTSETYDLVGEWRYKSDSRQYYVKVLNFNTKTKVITYEYEYHDNGSYFWPVESAKSSGPITAPCYTDWRSTDAIPVLTFEPPLNGLRSFTIVVGGSRRLDDAKPSGAGIAIGDYFLTKQ